MHDILIVDDEALVLFDLVMTVEDLGYRVHSESTTVDAAIAALDAGSPPDLALLDIDVGGSPVWPLARKIVSRGKPLVFISANLNHEELRGEFADCARLDKPASKKEIAEAIASVLEGQQTGSVSR